MLWYNWMFVLYLQNFTVKTVFRSIDFTRLELKDIPRKGIYESKMFLTSGMARWSYKENWVMTTFKTFCGIKNHSTTCTISCCFWQKSANHGQNGRFCSF